MRGMASMAKAVAPALASARTVSGAPSGLRKPMRIELLPRRWASSAVAATLTTTSAPHGSSTISAPASVKASSGMDAPAPAPDWTWTVWPLATRRLTTSGTRATRRSRSPVSVGTPILIGAGTLVDRFRDSCGRMAVYRGCRAPTARSEQWRSHGPIKGVVSGAARRGRAAARVVESVDQSIGFATRVVAWPCIADAGRRPRDRNSGGATGRSSGWRSGAARRGQAAARAVESVIYRWPREALPRDDVRLPDERARLGAHEGHARVARLRRVRRRARRRPDPLQHLLDPREGRRALHRPPAPGRRAQEARPGAGHRRRRLLGAVGQAGRLPPVPVRRRRLRPRPGPQARRVPHQRLADGAGVLRVRGLHRAPADEARPRLPGLDADLRRLQLPLLVLHRAVDAWHRGLAAVRRAGRRGRAPGRRRRPRDHAARAERQLLRARPAGWAGTASPGVLRAAARDRRDRHRAR